MTACTKAGKGEVVRLSPSNMRTMFGDPLKTQDPIIVELEPLAQLKRKVIPVGSFPINCEKGDCPQYGEPMRGRSAKRRGSEDFFLY